MAPKEKKPGELAAELEAQAEWLREKSILPTASVEAEAKERAAKIIRDGEAAWLKFKKEKGINSPH